MMEKHKLKSDSNAFSIITTRNSLTNDEKDDDDDDDDDTNTNKKEAMMRQSKHTQQQQSKRKQQHTQQQQQQQQSRRKQQYRRNKRRKRYTVIFTTIITVIFIYCTLRTAAMITYTTSTTDALSTLHNQHQEVKHNNNKNNNNRDTGKIKQQHRSSSTVNYESSKNKNTTPIKTTTTKTLVSTSTPAIYTDSQPTTIQLQQHHQHHHSSSFSLKAKIAYITFCHLNTTQRFETMVLDGALKTYLPSKQPFFVIFSDIWESKYHQLYYSNTTTTPVTTPATANNEQQQQQQLKIPSNLYPIFVDCPEGKFGEGPCCKQQKGLLRVLEWSQQQQKQRSRFFDFYAFYDDDVYLRHDYLQSYLTGIQTIMSQKHKNHTHTSPETTSDTVENETDNDDDQINNDETNKQQQQHYILVAGYPPKELGQMGYLPQHNMTYYCARKDDFKYPWGQPVIYPHNTLLHIFQRPFQQNALVLQCLEFGVTHDVGNAILHWMFSIDYVWFKLASWPDKVRADFMGNHAMGRTTPYQMNPNETTFAAIHQQYNNQQLYIPKEQRQSSSSYKLNFPLPHQYQFTSFQGGFWKTKTYKQYGDPINWTDEWHLFPKEHCNCRGC